MDKKEFDRIQAIGKKLKDIFARDRFKYADGAEDYIVRAVEEARKLEMQPSDVCSFCQGRGYFLNAYRKPTECPTCDGTGKCR